MGHTDEPLVSTREQVQLIRRVLLHRWWVIALCAVAAGAAAFATAKMLAPVYEASTTVRITREAALYDGQTERRDMRGRETLQGETAWFTSGVVLEPVIRRLALDEGPPASTLASGARRVKNLVRRLANRPEPEDAGFREVLDRLRKKALKVKELEGTGLLEIRVSWHDPDMAMRIANTMVDVFTERFQEFNRGRARQNKVYLDQQVQLVQAQLQQSEKDLVEFQRRTGLVAPDDPRVGLPAQAELQRLQLEKRQAQMTLGSLNAELEQLEGRQLTADGIMKGNQNPALQAALRNPNSLLRTLMSQAVQREAQATVGGQAGMDKPLGGARTQRELERLNARLKEELKRLGADPTMESDRLLLMVQEEEQQAGVSQNFTAQLQLERSSLTARAKASQDLLTRLEAEIGEAEKSAQELPDELQEYMALMREKRVNEELYTMLSARLTGAQVDENTDLYDVRVFDPAVAPTEALKPKPVLLAFIGTFMGLLLGLCVAFSMEYLNDSLRTTEDVQSYLGLPVLAEIPRLRARKRLDRAPETPKLVGHN